MINKLMSLAILAALSSSASATAVVPAPDTWMLLGAGVIAAALVSRRKK